MLVIRLTRIGKKNQPTFRVVLADKKRAVKGKFQEILGNYNPRLKNKVFKVERIKYWLSQGAKASPTVHNMLVSEKIISGPKVKAWRPKKKTQEAKAAQEAKTAGEQPVATIEIKPEASAAEKPAETTESVPATEAPAEEPKAEVKAV